MLTHEHFGSGVVHVDRLENRRAVVCDGDAFAAAHALQDLVLLSPFTRLSDICRPQAC
jgi:hypothetical protein